MSIRYEKSPDIFNKYSTLSTTFVLTFVLIGFIIRGIVTIVVVLVDYLSPWYLLFANIPAAVLGGLAPLMMAVLCYITDVTTEANRGMR